MRTLDKWFCICLLIGFAVATLGMGAAGGSPQQVLATTGIAGGVVVIYTALRGIYEKGM